MKKFQSLHWRDFNRLCYYKYERNIKFLCGHDGICKAFLIPFKSDVPRVMEEKINEILLESMNGLPEEDRISPNICTMKIWYKVDFSEEKTRHYIVINIDADNYPEHKNTKCNKSVLIEPQNNGHLYDEFVSYCKKRFMSLIWDNRSIFSEGYIDILHEV